MRSPRHRATADGKHYCSAECRRGGDNAIVKNRRDAERGKRLETVSRRVSFLERRVADVKAERDDLQAIIDRYCWSCEPEGACRTPACTTWKSGRSPLPMIDERLRIA
jgi:hypothetical protein